MKNGIWKRLVSLFAVSLLLVSSSGADVAMAKTAPARRWTEIMRLEIPPLKKALCAGEIRRIPVNITYWGDAPTIDEILANISFHSSNENVASMYYAVWSDDESGFYIDAVGLGKAKLTVIFYGKKTSCTIQIKSWRYKPQFVAFYGDDELPIILAPGEKYRPEPVVQPVGQADPRLKWSSSNTKVAKVSNNGTITALKRGKVTITATTINGKKGKCRVMVE